MSGRIRWIDIAKGMGILLVCLGHTRLGEGGPFASWVTSFHMPLFFVMAGLCFDEHRYATYGEYLKRKGMALAYPYFMLTVFIALTFSAFDLRSTGKIFHSMFVGVFPGQNVIGFWFLRVLILVELLYALLAKAVGEKWRAPALALAGIAGFFVPAAWCDDILRLNVVMISLGYYEIGHQCRRFVGRKERTGVMSAVAAGGFVLHIAVLWLIGFPMTQYGQAGYRVSPPVAIGLALLGTLWLSAVSMLMDRVRRGGAALAWLGQYSILLLAVHPTCGQLRQIWVMKCPAMAGGLSWVAELLLIVLLMWALAGPLNFFMKMPRMAKVKKK